MKGKPIVGPLHESLRLYAICKSMRWAHLPLGGGLYQQHPKLLDDWFDIMTIEGIEERRKADREKAQANRTGSRRPTPRRR